MRVVKEIETQPEASQAALRHVRVNNLVLGPGVLEIECLQLRSHGRIRTPGPQLTQTRRHQQLGDNRTVLLRIEG